MAIKILATICILSVYSNAEKTNSNQIEERIESWIKEIQSSSPNWEKDLEGWKNSPGWIRSKRADVPTTPQFHNPLVEAWLKDSQTSPSDIENYERWIKSLQKNADNIPKLEEKNPLVETWLKNIQYSSDRQKDLEGWKNSPNWVRH